MPPDSRNPSLPAAAVEALAACRRHLSLVQQHRADELSRRPLVCESCGETYPDIATYPLCAPCSAQVTIDGLRRRRDADLRLPPIEGVA